MADFCKDQLYFSLENAKLKDCFYFFRTKVHPLVLKTVAASLKCLGFGQKAWDRTQRGWLESQHSSCCDGSLHSAGKSSYGAMNNRSNHVEKVRQDFRWVVSSPSDRDLKHGQLSFKLLVLVESYKLQGNDGTTSPELVGQEAD